MNTETMQVTSQGEFIHKDASLEAKKPVESTLLIEDQPTLLTIEDAPKTGLISGLWNRVLGTTEAVVHMAEVASQTVKENASGLIATAHDAALAAEQAGEKWVEVTKEYVMDIEHKVEETAETKKEQLLELGSELQSQAQSTLSTVSQKLHDLSEVVVEQGQAKASELYDTASVVGEQAKEKASEALASAQVIGQQALESDTAKTVVSVGNDALEQAKEVGQQALAAGQKVIEQVNNEGVEGVAAKAKGMGLRAFSAAANLGSQAGIPLSKSASARRLKKSASANNTSEHSPKQTLALTMDVVSHIQRIADRTGDAVLHETARKAHSACAKGLSDAPGVHLVWITPQQANDLVNLAIRTQDHELADFARYCQSVAATTHIGVEPTPGKIQEEIQKGYQELQQQGRVHTGPGYGAAFASVNRTYAVASTDVAVPQATTAAPLQKSASLKRMNSQSNMQPPQLVLTMDVVSHIQRIADRTGNAVLHETARKAHSACAKGESDAPGVHLTWITPQQASELMNLASRTTNQELIDFARYCQSVAATTQVGVEPSPGKIQEEILKGRQELQKAQLLQPAAPVEATSTPVVSQEPAMLASM